VASQTSDNVNLCNNQKDHLCDFTDKLENCRQENEQLIEQNIQLKSLYTTLETLWHFS
jgi:predicted nuclease with TOPRIM domain